MNTSVNLEAKTCKRARC